MSRSTTTRSRRFTALTAATAVLTPTVLGVAAGPAGAAFPANDSYSYTGNPGPVRLDVLANDSVNATARIVSVSTPSDGGGSASPTANNKAISFSPTNGFYGTTTFTYTAEETTGGETQTTTQYSAQVSVTISKPTQTANLSATATAGQPHYITFGDSGLENLQITSPPDRGTTSVSGRTITYSTPPGPAGSTSFQYRYETPTYFRVGTISVTIRASAKTAVTENRSTSVMEGEAVTLDFLGAEPGTLTVTGGPSSGTAEVTSQTTIRYTAPNDVSGSATYQYRFETTSEVISGTVTVSVTPRGVADSATVQAGSSVLVDVLANDEGTIDPSTANLQVTGTPAGGTAVVESGKVRFTALPGFSAGSFSYSARDTSGQTFTGSASITITPAAEVPVVAVNLFTYTGSSTAFYGPSEVFTQVTPPSFGTASSQWDSRGRLILVYRSNSNYSGSDTFSYLYDTRSGQRLYQFQVTIAPYAKGDVAHVQRGESVLIPVLRNDQGTFLAETADIRVTEPPVTGTIQTPADDPSIPAGSVRYTPAANSGATNVTFQYTFKDVHGRTSFPARVFVSVFGTTAVENLNLSLNAGDSIETSFRRSGKTFRSVEVTSGPSSGEVVVDGDKVTYTPDAGFSGPDSYTYRVEYNDLIVTGTVFLDVNPVGVDDSFELDWNTEDTLLEVLDNDLGSFDRDSGAPVTITDAPEHGTITFEGSENEPRYTPDPGRSGNDSFSYSYEDETGQAFTADVKVRVRKTVPDPVVKDDSATVTAGDDVDVDVTANDLNVKEGTVVVTDAPEHATVTVKPTGEVTVAAASNFSGRDSFVYEIEGDDGTTATATVNLTIVPDAVEDDVSATEGELTVFDVEANDLGSLEKTTVEITTAPEHGVAVVGPDGKVRYTSDTDHSGADSFEYRLAQGPDPLEARLFSAAVANAPGVLYSEPTLVEITLLEGPTDKDYAEELSSGSSVVTDFNQSGDPVVPGTLTVTDGPDSGTVTVDATTGRITYTAPGTYSGPDSYEYEVENESGTFTGTVSLDVNPVGVADTASTFPGESVFVGVLDNDLGRFDREVGRPVTITDQPDHGELEFGFLKSEPTYVPDEGFQGVDTFSYTYQDSSGQEFGATATITVDDLAKDDAATLPAGTKRDVDVLANDAPDLDPTSVKVVEAPDRGAAVVDSDGSIVYTPSGRFSGADTLTYEVFDDEGRRSTALVTFTVTPVALDDALSTTANTPGTVDVGANDLGTVVSFEVVEQGRSGTATFNPADPDDPRLTYTPRPGFSGTDTVTYRLVDSEGNTDDAVVTIKVEPSKLGVIPPVEIPPVEPQVPAGPPGTEVGPAGDLAYTGAPLGLLATAGGILAAAGAAVGETLRRNRRRS